MDPSGNDGRILENWETFLNYENNSIAEETRNLEEKKVQQYHLEEVPNLPLHLDRVPRPVSDVVRQASTIA